MNKFNLRVYGLHVNAQKEILLSSELRFGRSMIKFPGGGLEFGEGHKECLKREFLEECGTEVEVGDLFYVNDFPQTSAFRSNEQLFAFYYWVQIQDTDKLKTVPFDYQHKTEGEQLIWIPVHELHELDLTFPIDRKVVQKLKEEGMFLK